MNKETFAERYLGKIVHIIFFDSREIKGKLELGDFFNECCGWYNTGFHIKNFGFKKSHIKKIEVF